MLDCAFREIFPLTSQNNLLTVLMGLVSARPILQDHDRLIWSSSAKSCAIDLTGVRLVSHSDDSHVVRRSLWTISDFCRSFPLL
jgi:hypothetical protein